MLLENLDIISGFPEAYVRIRYVCGFTKPYFSFVH